MNKKLSNIKKVGRWEFKKAIKSPTFLILTFVIPVLMLIVSGVGFLAEQMESDTHMQLILVDDTDAFYPYVEAVFEESGIVVETFSMPSDRDLQPIQQKVTEGDYTGYMVVQSSSLEQGTFKLYVKEARDVNMSVIHMNFETAYTMYRLHQSGLDADRIRHVMQPMSIELMQLTGEEINIASLLVPVFAGIALMIAVLFSGQVMMYGVIKEKQNRIVEILLSSISAFELLMGKILGFGLVSLAQMAIWAFVGFFVAVQFFDLPSLQIGVHELVIPFLYFLFGYLMLASLFAAVGATMKEAEGGSQLQGLVIIIPMIPLFLAAPIFMNPDALWVRIVSHIPPFIPTMVLLRMGGATILPWEIVTTLVALIASSYFFIRLGARVFERGIMQVDRTLSIKDIKKLFAEE